MSEYLGAMSYHGQFADMDYGPFQARPLNGSLGAEISGVDLSNPDEVLIEAIAKALLNHLVLFFENQKLSPQQLVNLGRRFGELHINPFAPGLDEYPEVMEVRSEENDVLRFAEKWHTDMSWENCPTMGSILHAINLPPFGGDTLFANMYLAYEMLDDDLKNTVDGMWATHTSLINHGAEPQYRDLTDNEVVHPVIRTHPVTQQKLLYVNEYFCTGIVGMELEQSQPLLRQLYQHAVRPDFCCRYRWQPGAVAFWDNRCTQHYATNDYAGYSRLMHRVAINGDKPF